jgi:hypothetical protein
MWAYRPGFSGIEHNNAHKNIGEPGEHAGCMIGLLVMERHILCGVPTLL